MRDQSPGNIEAFTQRLGSMRPKLHRYCARMTGSTLDGEDVVQETMIKAIEAFPLAAEIANVEAWVFRSSASGATAAHIGDNYGRVALVRRQC